MQTASLGPAVKTDGRIAPAHSMKKRLIWPGTFPSPGARQVLVCELPCKASLLDDRGVGIPDRGRLAFTPSVRASTDSLAP